MVEHSTNNTITLDAGMSGYMHLNIGNPAIAWLVYRGTLETIKETGPGFMSYWARAITASSPERIQREVRVELARERFAPHAISRLRGLYIFPDKEASDRAVREWGFHPSLMAEVVIHPGSRVTRYDSAWITNRNDSISDEESAAYVLGLPYDDNPHWEYLVEGKVDVLGTELRSHARDVVYRHWPKAKGLLELARLGAELETSLGQIVPFARAEGEDIVLDFLIRALELKDPVFLSQLGSHINNAKPGTVDFAALNDFDKDGGLGTPDLTASTIRIPRTAWP